MHFLKATESSFRDFMQTQPLVGRSERDQMSAQDFIVVIANKRLLLQNPSHFPQRGNIAGARYDTRVIENEKLPAAAL